MIIVGIAFEASIAYLMGGGPGVAIYAAILAMMAVVRVLRSL